MIALLMIATLVFTLLVNLTGLALAARRLIPNYVLARVASPLLLCMAMFCLEHAIGLGDLSWAFLPLTLYSLWLIWRKRGFLLSNVGPEILFLLGFGYAFLWAFCFPDIDGRSEKLGDLTFIRDYLSGTRLPPPDYWFPPFRFDVYYGFQYYSSALLGRILHLDPGTTYRLSLCVIVGLAMTAAGGAVYLLSGRLKRSVLVLAAFAFGGTGASLLARLFAKQTLLSDGMRFIGEFAVPDKMTTGLGKWLVTASSIPAKEAIVLPAETFGYLVYLGDHHPPMSGFLLLTLALLCIAIAEKEDELRIAPAILASTIPAVVAADAWNLPLQVLLVASWVIWRMVKHIAVPWWSLAAGCGGGFLLILPFLQSIGFHSLDYGVRLRLVPGPEHTPALLGLIVWAPFLLLLGGAALSARRGSEELRWCLLWSMLLLLTEAFYLDDVYSGKYNRFNSTLKWWPWIMAGMVLTLGPLSLTARRWVSRWSAVLALALTAWFAVPLCEYLILTPKPHIGRIDGAAWIMADPAEKPILEFLKNQRQGIVLQRLEADSFTFSPGLVIFSGQQAFLGWPAHEKLWRGNRRDIDQRSEQVKQFYRGDLPESAAWLLENKIDHVLWLKGEGSQLPPGTYDKIEGQIRDFYFWREYYRAGDFRVGVWSRREFPRAETPVMAVDPTHARVAPETR